jgi:hypothetical protein
MPRGRPKNVPHNRDSLLALAERIKKASEAVAKKAGDLEAAAGKKFVEVAYQASVDDGLDAVDLLCGDVDRKITQKKFIDVKVDTPPAKLPIKVTRKKVEHSK